MRTGLFVEIVRMSWETVRGNKMRSFLTVLGIVIGITSIVGMTSLIRGFDENFKDSIKSIGPDVVYISKFSGLSFAGGKTFEELMKRPNLTPDDAAAIERDAPSIGVVDIILGQGGTQERVYYKSERTKPMLTLGTTERYVRLANVDVAMGRYFTGPEVQHSRKVIVLGQTAYTALFPTSDPIGKTVRLGLIPYEVIGVAAPRPSTGLGGGQDDFVVIPQTSYQKQFGLRASNFGRGEFRPIMIGAMPRDGVDRAVAMKEVENVMRIRHGLHLDEPDDFDMITSDAVLKVWDQISSAAFLALVVLSSIALMVGGIGVMSIMTISVTERTREIGVRKALGARRVEVLWQFLFEAAFLTSLGGLIGILFGAGIGYTVHWLSGFPISLPWWAFAIGIGFSASVGIFFGMVPAIRASRMDPIDALRYE
jgi:putative ABC transport system permease protein